VEFVVSVCQGASLRSRILDSQRIYLHSVHYCLILLFLNEVSASDSIDDGCLISDMDFLLHPSEVLPGEELKEAAFVQIDQIRLGDGTHSLLP